MTRYYDEIRSCTFEDAFPRVATTEHDGRVFYVVSTTFGDFEADNPEDLRQLFTQLAEATMMFCRSCDTDLHRCTDCGIFVRHGTSMCAGCTADRQGIQRILS